MKFRGHPTYLYNFSKVQKGGGGGNKYMAQKMKISIV